MASFNKVILMGNLTRNPELRQTQSGTNVFGGSIAVNESYTAADGTKRDNTTFVEISAFGKTAEIITKYFHKGDPILVEGRLRQESWTDKQSGQARFKLAVIVERFEFVRNRDAAQQSQAAKPTAETYDDIEDEPPF